jgi:hypothetical protein
MLVPGPQLHVGRVHVKGAMGGVASTVGKGGVWAKEVLSVPGTRSCRAAARVSVKSQGWLKDGGVQLEPVVWGESWWAVRCRGGSRVVSARCPVKGGAGAAGDAECSYGVD